MQEHHAYEEAQQIQGTQSEGSECKVNAGKASVTEGSHLVISPPYLGRAAFISHHPLYH